MNLIYIMYTLDTADISRAATIISHWQLPTNIEGVKLTETGKHTAPTVGTLGDFFPDRARISCKPSVSPGDQKIVVTGVCRTIQYTSECNDSK